MCLSWALSEPGGVFDPQLSHCPFRTHSVLKARTVDSDASLQLTGRMAALQPVTGQISSELRLMRRSAGHCNDGTGARQCGLGAV